MMTTSSRDQRLELSALDIENDADPSRGGTSEEDSISAEESDSAQGSHLGDESNAEEEKESGEDSDSDEESDSDGESDSEEGSQPGEDSDSEEQHHPHFRMDRYRPALDAIDLDALASAAVAAKLKHDHQESKSPSGPSTDLTCVVQKPPHFGSSNLVYTILSSDNVKWNAWVPRHGELDQPDAQILISSFQTRALIRSRTSIPIPEVYKWELAKDNPVGVPYHLESAVEGTRLYEFWTGQWSKDEPKRMKVLRNLAEVMSQLRCFEFDKIGSLRFESQDAMPSVTEMEISKRDLDEFWHRKDPDSETPSGAFKSTKEYLAAILNLYEELPPEEDDRKRDSTALRLAVNSIPQHLDTPRSFTLRHPHFDFLNIFTNEEGDISGLINWNGVEALPRALGFAAYPSSITRDWDPTIYGYDDPDCNNEDSPTQLQIYRREYAACMANLHLPEQIYSADDTKMSQILEAISIAVQDEICRTDIIRKLLQFACEGNSHFDCDSLINVWLGHRDDNWTEMIRQAFEMMWHEE